MDAICGSVLLNVHSKVLLAIIGFRNMPHVTLNVASISDLISTHLILGLSKSKVWLTKFYLLFAN